MSHIITTVLAFVLGASWIWSADLAKDFDLVVQKMDAWNKANPSFYVTVATSINGEKMGGVTNLVRIMNPRRTRIFAEMIGIMGSKVDLLMAYDPKDRRGAISSSKLNYWAKIDEKILLGSSAFQSSDPLAPFDIRALRSSIKVVAEKEGAYEMLFFIPKAESLLGGNKDNPQKPLSNPNDATTIVITVEAGGFLKTAETVIGPVKSIATFSVKTTDEAEIAKLATVEPNYATMKQNELNIFLHDLSTLIVKQP